ncbi:MAG: 1,6-anhydro-N-acetylmuramyl-L-alanine amidase AmpD [Burkholderiales bacterium]|nr:1,6-anhydro-N-acetylmuramyl-L-alanine amidase AmpD [Burkholderiales bacterium]
MSAEGQPRPLHGTPRAASRRWGRPPALAVDASGRVAAATQIASPNCDARPAGIVPTLVIVHGISLPPGEFGGDGIERLFTNRLDSAAHPYYADVATRRVSAHFLVRRDGALVQFVRGKDRAWHAGASSWHGRDRCNDYSIGIEVEGADHVRYTAAQYTMLARLLQAIARRYPIAAVVGHSDVAPGRKTDPGPAFDWDRLAQLTGAARL